MNSSKNPMFRESMWEKVNDYSQQASSVMTLKGTIQKTFLLLMILVAFAIPGWMFASMPLLIGSGIIAFILALVVGFKPQMAPALSPIYAAIKGLFVGAVSLVTYTIVQRSDNSLYANAIPLAIIGTLVTLGVMLALYVTRIIKVTETMRSVIVGMTIAVFAFYAITLLASIAFPQVRAIAPFGSGPIGIGFSLFVIGLAAFNFLLDFDNVERGIDYRAPKFMEWYCAFGLLVTLVWLYIEILNLFRKLAGNR